MQWRCHAAVEEALWRAARVRLPEAALNRKRLNKAVVQRSLLYTTERDSLSSPTDDPAADLAARALFFTVADAAKIAVPLAELQNRGLLDPDGRLRVLDLGAGVGAMTLGLLSHFQLGDGRPEVSVVAVDTDRDALALFGDAVEHLRGGALAAAASTQLDAHVADVGRWDAGTRRFDLVLAGSVLNELGERAAAELTRKALSALAPGGSAIFIEPALREASRGLHRRRDELLAAGAGTVFAPCTRTVAPCPALEDERDWCHEDRAHVLPEIANQIANATGLRDGSMKFSYLVMRTDGETLDPASDGLHSLRVVSQPQRRKGQREAWVCGGAGRFRLRLQKRARSAENRDFERARRGDVLRVPDASADDLAKDTRVERVAPAGD